MQSIKSSVCQNTTRIKEFILLGFGNAENLNVLLFVLFIIIYTITLSGNLLIIVLVVTKKYLHTPMYFFLSNLSCLEICYTSAILPKMMANCLTGKKRISFWGCILQMQFFFIPGATECYLLAAMSYDRYLAICRPLHYVTLMNDKTCILLVLMSWLIAFLLIEILTSLLAQLTFCKLYEIDHFFCDFTPLVQLSCNDTWVIENACLITSSITILPTFFITVSSYTFIISVILKIPSVDGRQKAFSTCSSHLMVVSIFYGSLLFVYILPATGKFKVMKKGFFFFYSALTPMVNPFIYCLRNKEIKEILRKLFFKCGKFSESL
ncbi:olfactory receptor 6C74-like [Vipera latastei]